MSDQQEGPPSPIKFQRPSLAHLLEEVQERGPTALGVVAIILDKDGHGSFLLSGFTGPCDLFTVSGMLDWIKHDLMNDVGAT